MGERGVGSGKTKEKKQWILNWLKTHPNADVLDVEFHNAFFKEFGGERRTRGTGYAAPVVRAMILLAEMYQYGVIERIRIKLPNADPDFPNWVYSYRLRSRHHE